MGFRKQRLSVNEAKGIDMVLYLSGLGYQPVKIRNSNYWHCSPFKNEKTPLFKINRKLNCWYDHGTGNGGIIIYFGLQFYGCSISEFLQKLHDCFSFHQRVIQPSEATEKERELTILQSQTLTSFP